MSQLTWTVLDDVGGKFHVGIYHGEFSGHLMVYCDWKIIIVDFNVLETKSYSFYLGQEFCHLDVLKTEKGFKYALQKDNKAKTPLNIARKQADRRDSIKSILVIGCIFLVLVIVYFYKAIS